MQGHADIPLDEVGQEQARRAARVLAGMVPTAIVSSDSVRAMETAAALAEITGVIPRYDSRLRETHLGEWEGLSDVDVRSQFTQSWIDWHNDEMDMAPPGGEARSQVAARVSECITGTLEQLNDDRCTLVVVSHGAALRVGMATLLRLPHNRWSSLGGFANCAWSVLTEAIDPVTGEAVAGRWRLAEHNAGSLPDVVLSDDK
ncbi:MAG: hypothetical protein RL745_577 [Actinomycetota bacterium]